MSVIFPPALALCIADDRPPEAHELAGMIEKVWLEAYVIHEQKGDCQRAAMIARAALFGTEEADRGR